MSRAADTLRKARALIETKGWAQGWFAFNASGTRVNPWSPEATMFCAAGAMTEADATSDEYNLLASGMGTLPPCIVGWNDRRGRTKAEVLSAFDRAIALAEAQS